MKRLLLLLSIFILTGCESKTEYFTKVCTLTTSASDFTENKSLEVTYNNYDEVTNVVITNNYEGTDSDAIDAIRESAGYYNNEVLSDGVVITIPIDEEYEYEVIYTLDVLNMTDEEISEFNLKKNSIKLFNILEKDGYECVREG